MNRNENTKLRIIITLALGVTAMFLFYYLLGEIQHREIMRQTQEEMKEVVQYVEDSYDEANEPYRSMDSSFTEVFMEDISLFAEIMKADPDFEVTDSYLKGFNIGSSIYNLVIVDRKGKALATREDNNLWNPTKEALETLDEAFEFKDGTVTYYAPVSSMTNEEYYAEVLAGNDSIIGSQFSTWYLCRIDDGHALAMKAVDMSSLLSDASFSVWNALLENETIGQEGYAFAWSNQTGRILYHPDVMVTQALLGEIGLEQEDVQDRRFCTREVSGKRVLLYPALLKEQDTWVACAIPEEELEASRRFNRIVLSIVFSLLCAALIYYEIMLLRQKKVRILTDFTHSGKTAEHVSRKKKLVILTSLMLVLLLLFHLYLQTLYLMSTWAEAASRHTSEVEKRVEEQDIFGKSYTQLYDSEKEMQMEVMEEYLSKHPEQITASLLDAFSYAVHAVDLQVLDQGGEIVAQKSSMGYSRILEGETTEASVSPSEAVATQDDGRKLSDWMKDGRLYLLPMHGDQETENGFLYVRSYSFSVDMTLYYYSLQETLKRIQPGRGGFVFAVDIETKKFTSYPDEKLIGRDALEYGLTENQIKDNYCDYIQIDGVSYYAATDMIGNNMIYYAISKRNLLRGRIQVSAAAAILAAVLLFLTGICLYTSREQIELVKPDNERHIAEAGKNSPEYKVMRVMLFYLIATAALFAGYTSFRESADMGGILGYVLSGRWERGFNVFALTSAVLIMCRGGLVLFFASRFVQTLGGILPIRGGTILKMLGSLFTYLAVAVLLYQCALCFGLNPTALMASAGIVSVVVGIGANSLVGDILAGIFLLMEGNVQVGDVVLVGDFRGYVMELGIRMTKLFDMDNDNVKIIPNNEVRNVVHLTMRTSIVYNEFQIRYEERIEDVERIVREELKNAKKSPRILGGPVYIGVSSLGDNGVTMKMETKCHEPNRMKVTREVNHIVYTIFQKHNISVPYPQVTLHTGSDEMVERES